MLRTALSLLSLCIISALMAPVAAANAPSSDGGPSRRPTSTTTSTATAEAKREDNSFHVSVDVSSLVGTPQGRGRPLDASGGTQSSSIDSFDDGPTDPEVRELTLDLLRQGQFPECHRYYSHSFCSQSSPQTTAPIRLEAIEETVRRAVLSLTLPEPTIHVGPAPEANEWNMAVVGYPLWLWTDTPATLDATTTQDGITIDISARRRGVRFAMGDGNHVDCRTMHAWKRTTKPATASPSCGYTYTWPSLPKGNYTITATGYWDISWAALGITGTTTLQTSATRSLPVGELHALAVP